ncbi:YkvA family protein [Planomicrobium sp. CPCC 101079]|uniref:YkvA family protein n=1 Tax=Planomicrobium sp. CPCC 101079 TaxID=2599618 RepID=UPI0011B526FE|nr:YkvA family protein [Planomicrobium sp. CPCC 101079]TWT01582.1 DUF1232 domain-containing protein [Planomicrobium sp. CPCC 101079]
MSKKEISNAEFEEAVKGKSKYYSDGKFLEKVKKYGAIIGFKALHAAVVLYYSLKDPNLPNKDRMIIIGALGYLILPVDVIPDFIPVVGFTDDIAVIIAALGRVINSVSEESKIKAHQQLKVWFKDSYPYNEDDGFVVEVD